jgi:hypothetical protein
VNHVLVISKLGNFLHRLQLVLKELWEQQQLGHIPIANLLVVLPFCVETDS